MTQKDKELLFKVLCTSFPYGVKLHVPSFSDTPQLLQQISDYETIEINDLTSPVGIDEVKPYLRPMSSMTNEERLELSKLTDDKFKFYLYTAKPEIVCYEKYNYLEGLKVLDWLNAHHLDYRGLIEKGLALEASEDMYNFK